MARHGHLTVRTELVVLPTETLNSTNLHTIADRTVRLCRAVRLTRWTSVFTAARFWLVGQIANGVEKLRNGSDARAHSKY